jgi:NTP pyrophosphatase (non-canonical NTP hydrolase)
MTMSVCDKCATLTDELNRQDAEIEALKAQAETTPIDLAAFQRRVHETAVAKGWWEGAQAGGTPGATALFKIARLALITTEVAEAIEAVRHGGPADEHCPEHTSEAIELADAVIRILDFAAFYGLDLVGALETKASYNEGREHRHGGKLL